MPAINLYGKQLSELETKIVEALREVYDPEIPVNIYDLGLIYEVHVDESKRHVDIKMTLTAPGCPVAGTFPDTVRARVESVEGIDSASVELVFYPPWNPDLMTEAARLELGMF
jgi:FeS assembly SUF system protein